MHFYAIIKLLTVILSLFVVSFRTCFAEPKPDSKIVVTVFIHGTIYVPFTLGSHKDQSLRNDQILLQEGLEWIYRGLLESCEFYDIPDVDPKLGYLYLAAAYSTVAKVINSPKLYTAYVGFGWSGKWDHDERTKAGLELYAKLCDMRDSYRQRFSQVDIILVTYSHGGNVALWLPEAEKLYKRRLRITSLVMFGTPFYATNKKKKPINEKEPIKGTASCVASPLFKTIISCYSDGD